MQSAPTKTEKQVTEFGSIAKAWVTRSWASLWLGGGSVNNFTARLPSVTRKSGGFVECPKHRHQLCRRQNNQNPDLFDTRGDEWGETAFLFFFCFALFLFLFSSPSLLSCPEGSENTHCWFENKPGISRTPFRNHWQTIWYQQKNNILSPSNKAAFSTPLPKVWATCH